MRARHEAMPDEVCAAGMAGVGRALSIAAIMLALVLPAFAGQADEPKTRGERTTRFHLGIFAAGSFAHADLARSPGSSGTEEDQSFFWGASLGIERPIFEVLRLRLEFEGTNERRFDFALPGGAAGDRSHIEAWTFDGNFWISYPLRHAFPDTPVVNRISPFGGGGIGLSRMTFEATEAGANGSEKFTKFAWQGGVGVSLELTRWLSLDTRYQYADLGRATLTLEDGGGTPQGELEIDLGAHEVLGGFRFVY